MTTQSGTRRLVTEDSLRRQPRGQALLIYKDLPAIRLRLRPWNRDRRLRALQAGRADRPRLPIEAQSAEAGGPPLAPGS